MSYLRVLLTEIFTPTTLIGSSGPARTDDKRINSAPQLPTVLRRNILQGDKNSGIEPVGLFVRQVANQNALFKLL